MKSLAAKKGLKSPAHAFLQHPEKQTDFLYEYAKAAVAHGFNSVDIADCVIKWRYPAKLLTWKDVSHDQAAAAMVFAITSKVNWFEMLQGRHALVEDRALLNGVFGRRTSNFMDMEDTVAGVLYIINHAIHKEMPQSPFVMFAETARTSDEMEAKRQSVLQSRGEFEQSVQKELHGDHWLKAEDKKHQDDIKFKLLCTVFDKEKGRLYVVHEKDPKLQHFCNWVTAHLGDILSLGKEDIAKIKAFVGERDGLLGMMEGISPSKPWKYLKEELNKRGGIFQPCEGNGNDYKQAVKIWRYALLMQQVKSVASYEQRWQKISEVESILKTILKIACDDGRQSGDIKVLGGMLTKKEFLKLFVESNDQMHKLRCVPHYMCGYETTMHNVHNALFELIGMMEHEPDGIKRKKFNDFMSERVGMVIRNGNGENFSSVSGLFAMASVMPAPVGEELHRMNRDLPPKDKGMHAIAETLYNLFCSGNRLYRVALVRAVNNHVVKHDGLVEMDAATNTYRSLDTFGIRGKFTFEQINSLINEKISRRMFDRYKRWAAEAAPGKFQIEFYMDTFDTGQAVEVPPKPKTAEEYLNIVREDYFFKHKFTPDELAGLFADFPQLEAKETWNLPLA
jgi:hypothetical protein